MDEELLYYWKQVAHLDVSKLKDISESQDQPVLKIGLSKALLEFAKTGNFENLERIGETMVSFSLGDEFDDEFDEDLIDGDMFT